VDHVILPLYPPLFTMATPKWVRDYNLHLTMWILLRTEVLLRIVLSLHCVEMVSDNISMELENQAKENYHALLKIKQLGSFWLLLKRIILIRL